MKIAVIGSGAIGGLVAGYLKLKGADVSLIGHSESIKAIKENGLWISGVRGDFRVDIDIFEKLNQPADLIILATKTQDLEKALAQNLSFLSGATVLTTQNGVRADEICARFVPQEKIISGIVMFGATSLKAGEVVHNFEGSWILGKIFSPNDAEVLKISQLLDTVFPTVITDEIKGMKFLKIFVNANNCIPGILGLIMQEAFSDLKISRISIAIWKEGLEIVGKAGINLVSLPDFPLERLMKLTALPILEAAKIYSGIMSNLSKEPLYGSILQSIKRGKSSEIDYLNGEFVNLARAHNAAAPLNEKLAAMVHQVEKTGKFFSKEELIRNTQGLIN